MHHTIWDLERLTGITAHHILGALNRGELHGTRAEGQWRVTPAAVEMWLPAMPRAA